MSTNADFRIAKLLKILRERGYTDRYVASHWDGNWPERRWYSLDAGTILQIITADVYTRIALVDGRDSEPFSFLQYVSRAYPHRPKTLFHYFEQERKSSEEVQHLVETLTMAYAREAA